MRRAKGREDLERACGLEPPPHAAAFLDSLGEEADRRASDQALLRELTDSGELFDREQDAFDDMLDRLARGQRQLTPAQREWAESAADRIGISIDSAARNRDVPRGREVETPEALSPESLKKALAARRAAASRR